MKIAVVYECRISGGTDRLLLHLIKNWPSQAYWEVVCFEKNSGIGLFARELKGYAALSTFGIGRTLDDVYEFLRERGWIGLFLAKHLRRISLPFICLKQFFYFKNFFKRIRPDIVYLHQGGYPGAFSENVAGLAAKIADRRIKVVMSIQNIPMGGHIKFFSRILDKVTNSFVDHFIFASSLTMQEYLKKTTLRESSMNIVPEGVMANLSVRRFIGQNPSVNIGIIGSYEERKGHKVLFDALHILKTKGITNFQCHCFGQQQFGDFQGIMNYAKVKEIFDFIRWHEFERDFDRLYGPLDILVQASITLESMPLVPIDAAAYFKPVVAARIQGNNEVIDHAVTGYLFDIGDSQALARYLGELILDPQKREWMGQNARQRYEERFTARRMAKDYFEIFQSKRFVSQGVTL